MSTRSVRWYALPLVVAAALVAAMVVSLPDSGSAAVTQTQLDRRGKASAYRFIAKVNGKPVHWDKCSAIGYRVSRHRLPRGGVRMAREAMRRMASTSGLKVKYQGRTKLRPAQGKNYKGRLDLVIGWLLPRESKLLSSGTAGYGGASWSGTGEIFTGFVQINRKMSKKIKNGFGRGPRYGYQGTEGQLLMHEIGHAVGLTHVRNKPQIMYPSMTRKLATWGAGDKNGLVRVGKRRSCF